LNGRKENIYKRLSVIVESIKKADSFLEKNKIYAILCIAIICVVSVLLWNSFYQTKTFSNYANSVSSSIHMVEGQSVRFSFDAQRSRLSSIILEKDASKSRLNETDTIDFTIYDSAGNQVAWKEVFLYHPHRNYISVMLTGMALTRGERYTAEMTVSNLTATSVLYMKMHSVSVFETELNESVTFDTPLGFRYVPNVSYNYSVLSMLSMAVHVSFFVLSAAVLFFDRIRKTVLFCDAYRSTIIILFLYVFTEMLNVARDDALQFLFPFGNKTIILIASAIVIITIIYLVLYFVSARGSLAMFITASLVITLGYINHSKIVMRGDPFMPWDIYAAGVAAKCSSQYDFRITVQFVASFFMVAAIILMIRLSHRSRIKSVKIRMIGLIATLVAGTAFSCGFLFQSDLHKKLDISYSLYPPLESYNENGTILSFFLHLNNIKPKGVIDNTPEQAADIIRKYDQIKDDLGLDRQIFTQKEKPNVICVMSESFADLRLIRDFRTSEPVLPFYDSILDDTLHGELQVSIFAGGTCNTEFEFLTGYSVAGLLPGSSVYTFYIKEPMRAMPTLFRENGYRTLAIHPFDPQWWDRDRAYPMLGFDEYISQGDFEEPKIVRRFISDESAFYRIIEEYEKTPIDTPFFTFCITMQNHADYSVRWENQKYDIKIESFSGSSFPYAENYLSLLRESDDALRILIEYFQSVDEPTLIVFFGDHLATLDHGFYDMLLDTNINQISAEESLPLYSTPYLIWSNYDLPTGYMGLTSPNFLGQAILDYAGIRSPAQRSCLRVLGEHVSAISALAVFDKNGYPWLNRENLPEEVIEIIMDYERIQYGDIFFPEAEGIE